MNIGADMNVISIRTTSPDEAKHEFKCHLSAKNMNVGVDVNLLKFKVLSQNVHLSSPVYI